MEDSSICRLGVKVDLLHNSQLNDTPQQHDSNYGSTTNKKSLEEDESSSFIAKNRNLLSPVFCTQESREESQGPEAGANSSDCQQDSEGHRNEEKTLGNTLCLGVGHFHMLLV